MIRLFISDTNSIGEYSAGSTRDAGCSSPGGPTISHRIHSVMAFGPGDRSPLVHLIDGCLTPTCLAAVQRKRQQPKTKRLLVAVSNPFRTVNEPRYVVALYKTAAFRIFLTYLNVESLCHATKERHDV